MAVACRELMGSKLLPLSTVLATMAMQVACRMGAAIVAQAFVSAACTPHQVLVR